MKNAFIFTLLAVGIFFCMFAASRAYGENVPAKEIKMDDWASIIILDNGRLKPLDTYARKNLLKFSGRRRYKGMSAIQWLGRVMFVPLSAANDKVFLINNPEVADAIGIAPEKRRRYCFNELKKGYHKLAEMSQVAEQKEPKERSLFETEAIRTFRNLQDYLQLSSVLMFLMPYPEFTVNDSNACAYLGLPLRSAELSFYDLLPKMQLISSAAKKARQKDKNSWTVFEMTMISLDQGLFRWNESRSDQPFHIIPKAINGKNEWFCPWIITLNAGPDAQKAPEIASLAAIRTAFVNGDEQAFATTVKSFCTVVRRSAQQPSPGLELFYNAVNPFARAKIFYGIAAVISLVLMTVVPQRRVYLVCLISIIIGALPHTFGLIARSFILHRPPLATIYETFLFVAWTCVALGLVVEFLQKKNLGLLIASVCGFFFLHLAGKYNDGEDSMGMIAAVLNSNFWLTTHIMSVSLGYAGCCCAGIVGHVYLIKKLFLKTPDNKLVSTSSSLYGILAFGLVFTVIGTMLGGMWADQSWGRFWGWDPKENGALLIILWCAVVFHARAAGIIRQLGTALGAIIGFILVMFAWIGVNLLGIGMHSYGFTTTGRTLLYSFMLFESVFLLASGTAYFVTMRFSRTKKNR
jgi:ABC-type transport system involved in cytochrome c biogenesis permease subunit